MGGGNSQNIFDYNALLFLLKNKMSASLDGGAVIAIPVLYGVSSAVGSYSGFEQLDTSNQQGIARAELNWKQYFGSVVISGSEERQNQGEAAIASLLQGKIQQMEMSLRNTMNTDAFSDGTTNSSKGLDGLAIAVDSTGTYAGIARATYAWWGAQETAVTGALTIKRLNKLFNDCSQGGRDYPDLHITDQDEYEAYEALLQPDQRFKDNRLADGGFITLTFKDKPVTWDKAATAGMWYMINTSYMGLKYHPQANFTARPFEKPFNQDAKVSLN